jgi:hypothetical protein
VKDGGEGTMDAWTFAPPEPQMAEGGGQFLAAEDAMKNQVDILKQSKVNLYLFAGECASGYRLSSLRQMQMSGIRE